MNYFECLQLLLYLNINMKSEVDLSFIWNLLDPEDSKLMNYLTFFALFFPIFIKLSNIEPSPLK